MIRINKFLSQCGITSRRGAEKLIEEGRVKVNDIVIDQPGTVIDEEKDIIKVDDKSVHTETKKYYIILHKPPDVLTTMTDPFKRKTVAYFVKKLPVRVYPVGRLDYDTEGVLLMTNDGDLAYRLSHPKYEIKRVYRAIVRGTMTSDKCQTILDGIKLEDGHIGKAQVRIVSTGMNNSRVEVVIYEGHKREVKQLLKAVGNEVIKLSRVEFAGLHLQGIKRGRWRHLKNSEIKMLMHLVGLE
ncbi:MAG: pseudouridine synthase [Candidatus Zixiibacteriota bacterium]